MLIFFSPKITQESYVILNLFVFFFLNKKTFFYLFIVNQNDRNFFILDKHGFYFKLYENRMNQFKIKITCNNIKKCFIIHYQYFQ